MARTSARSAAVETEELEMQITPLIDVVFLLLVFFLTSINFRSMEGFLRADVPPAAPPTSETPKDDTVTILLDDAGGRLTVKVNTVAMEGSTHVELFESLSDHLAGIQQTYTRTGEDMPLVVIDASGTLLYKYVVAALNICGKLDIANISFVLPE
jgi:biopolymer transport protein ExbD